MQIGFDLRHQLLVKVEWPGSTNECVCVVCGVCEVLGVVLVAMSDEYSYLIGSKFGYSRMTFILEQGDTPMYCNMT